MAALFLSYRRSDTDALCLHLYQRLVARYGADNVFRDTETLRIGQYYVQEIEDHIKNAQVFLVLIGPNWLESTDEQGNRRIDKQDDLVRKELLTALEHHIPIIPIFVDLPRIPQAEEVPSELREVLYWNGLPLDQNDFATAYAKLIPRLDELVVEADFQYKFFAEKKVLLQKMQFVQGGEYTIGRSSGMANESPPIPLTLASYGLATYPVTVAEYALFVAEEPDHRPREGHLNYWKDQLAHPYQPVINISWFDALAYTHWLASITGRAFRLPSEGEWEVAAKGPQNWVYPWDPQTFFEHRCNARVGEKPLNAPNHVKRFAEFPSPFGCIDMVGNVWEWTATKYAKQPSQQVVTNIKDIRVGDALVVRGGAWSSPRESVTTFRRRFLSPELFDDATGFRLALSL